MRWGKWIGVGLPAVALLAPAVASAAVRAPGAFRVRASNGFEVTVLGAPARNGRPGVVLVSVSRLGERAVYAATATVGTESIEADLGGVGRIDVHYAPDGGTRTERSSCAHGKASYDTGFYEGTIELHGEEGYTEVEATRARGEVKPLLRLLCGSGNVSEGFGGHAPGARLTGHRSFTGGRVELEARINSPTRPSRFSATIDETRGRVQVERSVRVVAAAGAFRFDVGEGRATLTPPPPFAGAGEFERRGSGPGRLSGTLSIDFPGRSSVRLAGPGTRAGLERFVDNPSHPFRPASSVVPWPSTKR
jgi:hypothetical protein